MYASFISDKNVGRNNSTLLANWELYNMEIRWKCCNESHIPMAKKTGKIHDIWQNIWKKSAFFDQWKMTFLAEKSFGD